MLRTRYILARGCRSAASFTESYQRHNQGSISENEFWLSWNGSQSFWNFESIFDSGYLEMEVHHSVQQTRTEWLHDQIKVTFSYLKFRIFQSGRKYQSNNKAAELTLEHQPACPPYLQHCSWHRLALLCCCITASSASSHVLLTVACLYWSG